MTIRAILLCIATCTIANGGVKLLLVYAAGVPIATNEDNVCSSTECLNVASELSKIMDPTIDPCENFYEFACGGFLKSEPVDESLRYNEILEEKIYADVRQLIEADIVPNEPKSFKLVKGLYKSCMNTTAIEAKGYEPLRKYLRDLGGWPVVEGDSWNGKNFDWRRTIYKFRRDGKNHEYYIGDAVGYLLRFGVERDERHPRKQIISTKYSIGLLPRRAKKEDYDKKESFLRIYYDSMVQIAQMLGADDNRATSEIREILDFEMKLNEIKLPIVELAKLPEFNRMTIAELNEKYPTVPWMMYIRKFVPSSIRVTDAEIINVPDPNYYVRLEALMANIPKRIQANYVMSRIALRNALLSTEEMRTIVYRVLAARSNFPTKEDRPNYCASEVMDHLWQGVTALWANTFLNKETKDAAKELVTNFKRRLEDKLRAYNWPNEEARTSAFDKLAGFITHVGYPDRVLDQSKLEELYANLDFTEDDYFGNMNILSNYDHELGDKELEAPSHEIDEWNNLSGPAKINSAYYILKNSIHIAAGHLQHRFFGKDRPKYMNYGALGSYIGHEMIHAFFENGLYRGSNGENANYYGLAKRREFASRAQCLIDQYESYQVDNKGTKLDGRKTLAENLADIGGMRLAYDAYEKWAAGKPEEPKLRGLEQYSAKQMFWLSSAAIICEKIKLESIPEEIRFKEHTIGKFRVIGTLSNMPEFAKDYNCTATSLMNPAKRCDIWQS